MKIIDISWPIKTETTEYKDKGTIKIEYLADYETGNFEETKFCMGSHTGTHVDAPRHFIKNGKTIDQLSLDKFIGNCQVIDLTSVEEKITKADLEKHTIKADNIILLKTKNSFLSATAPFNKDFIYLETIGAEYLVSLNIKAVGIDYLGIERNQPNHETHIALLSKDIPIFEGLRLEHVQTGEYNFIGLPLHFINLEAAPARCILTTVNNC